MSSKLSPSIKGGNLRNSIDHVAWWETGLPVLANSEGPVCDILVITVTHRPFVCLVRYKQQGPKYCGLVQNPIISGPSVMEWCYKIRHVTGFLHSLHSHFTLTNWMFTKLVYLLYVYPIIEEWMLRFAVPNMSILARPAQGPLLQGSSTNLTMEAVMIANRTRQAQSPRKISGWIRRMQRTHMPIVASSQIHFINHLSF